MNETETFLNSSCLVSMDIPMNYQTLSSPHQAYRYVIFSIGTVVNIFVPVVIVYSRQLHFPRHVFWAGLSFCNLLQILQSLMESLVFIFNNRIMCQIFVLNASTIYNVILLFLALGALDRYLAIARYEWYKKKVTLRAVIYLLLFSSLLTCLFITSPFWTGFLILKNCTINLTHMHWVLVYDLLLGIVCVVLHIMIFIRSRSVILQHSANFHQTPISLPFHSDFQRIYYAVGIAHQNTTSPGRLNENEMTPQEEITTIRHGLQQQQGAQNSQSGLQRQSEIVCFPRLCGRSKFSRLEFRAAFNMSINVLPVWLCTFPVALNAIALYWCIRLKLNCFTIFRINPYVKDLFLLQIIYNPVMYMFSSSEFRSAFFRFSQK